MAKPWHDRPLWEKVFLGRHSRVYMAVGTLVGHLGCNAFSFWDRAKLRPDYDKPRFDDALRDLTDFQKRERGEYHLTPLAKKVLRIYLGPAPDDPEYTRWWRARLVSVEKLRAEGKPVEWADAPPVPLAEDTPKEEPKAKKPRKKKAS